MTLRPARLSTRPCHALAGRGFSLAEVLVALAVVALLLGLALPTYREHLARVKRTDVQAMLLEDAGYLQRYYGAHNAFAGTPAPELPAPVSPRQGPTNYRIDILPAAEGTPGFTLVATRTGSMAADPCGDFTYDDLARRDLAPGTAAAGHSAANCWR